MSEVAERITVSDEGYSLPVVELMTGRGFVTGKSGSGKSNTANVICEELLDQNLPLLIVDTDGEYYGLKEEYELLHVGADEQCDLELAPGDATEQRSASQRSSLSRVDAERLAGVALEENLPIILDVSGYLDEEYARTLIHDVVRALFAAEKQRKKPFLLLIEEAHEFIPESGGADDLSKMLIRVAKRGRKRGLGVLALSQRPAAVDKDYITQCDWIVWHRLTWDNDTAVVDRILGGDAADRVPKLDAGEALVLTDWDESVTEVQFRRKRTFDAGATPDLDDFEQPDLKSVDGDLLAELAGDGGGAASAASGDRADDVAGERAGEDRTEGSEPADAGTTDGAAASRSAASDGDTSGSSRRRGSSGRDSPNEGEVALEIGEIVVHVAAFLVASQRWFVDETAALLARAADRLGVGRTGAHAGPIAPAEEMPGARSSGADGRSTLLRALAALVVIATYAAVFLAVVAIV